MDKVIIEKLKIVTCHGVNDYEKVQPQPFEFSAEIFTDFYGAAQNDDISGTVNYSSVCKLICAIATSNVFNLIETLAWRCAEGIMENFPSVRKVRLRVDKPEAPVKAEFSTVAAETVLERKRAILSLGSSVGDKKGYLDFALNRLASVRGVSLIKSSSYINSAPYGGVAENTFLNACAEIETYLPPRALLSEIHRIEAEGDRTRDLRWGDRTLDIDIIFYGDEIICEEGLNIPHADYLNRSFVIGPMKEIVPDFFCPDVRVRVKDLPEPSKN